MEEFQKSSSHFSFNTSFSDFLEMSLQETFFSPYKLSVIIKETLMNPESYASMIFLYIEVLK
jgi:hypothetical protein